MQETYRERTGFRYAETPPAGLSLRAACGERRGERRRCNLWVAFAPTMLQCLLAWAFSSAGERCLHTAEVTGSKPVTPTMQNPSSSAYWRLGFFLAHGVCSLRVRYACVYSRSRTFQLLKYNRLFNLFHSNPSILIPLGHRDHISVDPEGMKRVGLQPAAEIVMLCPVIQAKQ